MNIIEESAEFCLIEDKDPQKEKLDGCHSVACIKIQSKQSDRTNFVWSNLYLSYHIDGDPMLIMKLIITKF